MTDTQHYQLNQWAADDQVLRTDFNADNAKIDAALGAVKGCNCRLYVETYTGTGENGPVVHTYALSQSGDDPAGGRRYLGFRCAGRRLR